MAKVQVRDGFVVQIQIPIFEKDPKTNEPTDKIKDIRVQEYHAGDVADLTEKQIRDHAHKLEPLDVEALKLMAPVAVAGVSVDEKQVAKDHAAKMAELGRAAAAAAQ